MTSLFLLLETNDAFLQYIVVYILELTIGIIICINHGIDIISPILDTLKLKPDCMAMWNA